MASRDAAVTEAWSPETAAFVSPAASPRNRAVAPTAAARRASASTCRAIGFESAITAGAREGNVTSLATVRAIIETVRAELDVLLALADRAIFLAVALMLGLVTLHAKHGTLHRRLLEKLYLTRAGGSKQDVMTLAETVP